MNTFKKLFASATIVAVTGVAFAQMSHDGMKMMDMESMQGMMKNMMPAESDLGVSTKAFKQVDMDMMHGMSVEYTGNADVDFRTKMIRITKARSPWRRLHSSSRWTRRPRQWVRRLLQHRKRRSPRCRPGWKRTASSRCTTRPQEVAVAFSLAAILGSAEGQVVLLAVKPDGRSEPHPGLGANDTDLQDVAGDVCFKAIGKWPERPR